MFTGPIDYISQIFKSSPDWVVNFFLIVGPIFLIGVLALMALGVYRDYVQEKFISNIKWTLFEIRLPKDVLRTPLAMELVIQSLHQSGGVGTWVKRFIEGAVLMWFSLEIVSDGGQVRFFIRTPNKFRDYLKSQIYAQYPQAEVLEVEDYTRMFPYYEEKSPLTIFGAEFKLAKPDPYPIKTYIDYGLDRSVGLKDEEKVDPINQVIEFMGSINPREHLWWQTIVRFHPKRFKTSSSFFKKRDWTEEASELRNKLLKDFKVKITDKDGKEISNFGELTTIRKEIIDAIERSVTKYGFDTGIRVLYLAESDSDFVPERIPAFLSMFKPFGSEHLNSFKPDADTIPDFDYKWQDRSGKIKEERKTNLFRSYLDRGYFYSPYKKEPFVLNSEELATLFHFPGQTTVTPGLGRVSSRTSKPPTNLPNN